MTEKEFESELYASIHSHKTLDSGVQIEIMRFKDAGIQTGQHGLVFYVADGSEFQLVIVKSP